MIETFFIFLLILSQKIKEACRPTRKWGPKSQKLRSQWLAFKQEKEVK